MTKIGAVFAYGVRLGSALLLTLFLAHAPARAGEGGGGEAVEPIVQNMNFVRTANGRMRVWSVKFRIDAQDKAALGQISERLPRITDGILVRLTHGPDQSASPTIDEIKQAIIQTVEERLGGVVGLDITVMRLKQTS